jgi:hypothetical protein
MNRRDPEAWTLVLVVFTLALGFIVGWGLFVRWLTGAWG